MFAVAVSAAILYQDIRARLVATRARTIMYPTRPGSLAALQPAPSEVAREAAPPWPPPALRVPSVPPPFPDRPANNFIMAFAFAGLAMMTDVPVLTGLLAVGSGGMLIVAIRSLAAALRERPAQLSAHAEHSRRAHLTWARIVGAEIVGERRSKYGSAKYEIEVQLEVWPGANANDSHGPTVPAPVSHHLVVPASVSASVVPCAYLGVLHDPVDRRVVVQSLVTRDGAQFPL
jgi:hypothetical protein